MPEAVIENAYKCPDCGLVARFNISEKITGNEDEGEYIKEVLERRRICDEFYMYLYLPPRDEWESEAEDIKRRLEALGYV